MSESSAPSPAETRIEVAETCTRMAVHIQVDGDRAVCTASFQATHRLTTSHGAPLWTLGGDYRWELVRADGRWLINAVVMTARWGDGNQGLPAQAAG